MINQDKPDPNSPALQDIGQFDNYGNKDQHLPGKLEESLF